LWWTVAGNDLVERIGAACTAQLADFKRPHEVRLVSELPRSTLEKIAKAELRRMLEAEGAAPSAA
jgi:crotonobetaine/carnitine-CoA ligase